LYTARKDNCAGTTRGTAVDDIRAASGATSKAEDEDDAWRVWARCRDRRRHPSACARYTSGHRVRRGGPIAIEA
jgi:hypothetical protein